MEIASRSLWTLVHGMGFGVLYLLACSGALVELYGRFIGRTELLTSSDSPLLKAYLVVMSLLAWLAVLSGTYLVYPWYRATPPTGAADLRGFPQKLLMSNLSTIGWHSIGMEWKEHVAWLVPITITLATVVVAQYGSDLRNHPKLRSAVLTAVLFSLASSGIAAFWGAMINKYAPIEGGPTITVMKGATR